MPSVRHLSKPCEHRGGAFGYDRLDEVRGVTIEYIRCMCGEMLPLGPAAAETPEVAVERRAAELAALGRDAASMWLSNEMSDCERDGWEVHMRDWDHITIEGADWAGYLARQISTHDQDVTP